MASKTEGIASPGFTIFHVMLLQNCNYMQGGHLALR